MKFKTDVGRLSGMFAPQRRVLVVDDERLILTVVARLFEAHGYVVDACGTSAEAAARLAANRYCAAVIDVMLAHGESGLDVAAAVRAACPQAAVVLMSGSPLTAPALPGTGRVDVVEKPFDVRLLVDLVGAYVQ